MFDIKKACFSVALLLEAAVSSGLAIADPSFRSDYAHIVETTAVILAGSQSLKNQSKAKAEKPQD